MVNRTARISEEIKRDLSAIIKDHIKDPRLPEFISIIAVDTTKDLRYAKVYVSVLGDDKQKKEAAEALRSAAGFLRRELGKTLTVRMIPELIFKIDSSIEESIRMSSLIDKTIKSDREKGSPRE